MNSIIKNEKKNIELLQELSKRIALQKQLNYYRNVLIVALIAVMITAWMKADWKWILGSFLIFLVSALNYFQLFSSPTTATAAVPSSHQRNSGASSQSSDHLATPSTSSASSSIYFDTRGTIMPDMNRSVKSSLHSSTQKTQSPLFGGFGSATRKLPPLSKPTFSSSPLLKSPEIGQNRDNYDFSMAKKIASQVIGAHQKETASKQQTSSMQKSPSQLLFSPNNSYSTHNASNLGGTSLLNLSSFRSPISNHASNTTTYQPREYQISPLNAKPVQSNAVQHKDALQSLGLTQIPDEWIDELRLRFRETFAFNHGDDMIEVLKRALLVPVFQGGISEKDYNQALVLLDHADQDRTEKLENGHAVNLKNLLEYIRTTNLIPNMDDFINQFEFALSFFRLCQSIIKQKQQNIQKIQEIERMKNDIIDEQSRNFFASSGTTTATSTADSTNTSKDRKKGFIIDKLQQLVNNSYEKRLIIQWRHSHNSGFSGIKFDSFFPGNDSAASNLSGKDALITDQEIVLALFLHRCNHLSQTMFNNSSNMRLKAMVNSRSGAGSAGSTAALGENTFSEEHLIFNYTIDLYRMIKLLQERNREDDNQRLTLSNQQDDVDIDSNENSIVSFIYHTPNTIQSENLSPNPHKGREDSLGLGSIGNVSTSSTGGGLLSGSSTTTVASSIQDYIQSIKNPHFDIIKITYNGKKREIFKIDSTRNDCYESIIIFMLIIYVTTIFHYYHYDPNYMNYDEMMEQFEMKDGLFEKDYWNSSTTSTAMGGDGSNSSSGGGGEAITSAYDLCNQRDFRIIKSFIDKIIPKADLRHMLIRFHQQNISGGAGGGIYGSHYRSMHYENY